MTAAEEQTLRARRFGWTSLAVWASIGLVLEGARGYRMPWLVADELAHTLVRLGHAPGVGLALVVLAFASNGVPLLADREDGGRSVATRLIVGALAIPIGFTLSAIRHPEGDPSIAIAFVPIGALSLVSALASLAFASWRRR